MYLEEYFQIYSSKKPIHQAVYEILRDSIVTGIIPYGERIIEEKYATLLKVSRTPVRKALYRLVQNGLATSLSRGGVKVKGLSIEGIHNIFNLQSALEHLAFPYTVKNVRQSDIQNMIEMLDVIYRQIPKNLIESAQMNEDLHKKLFSISKFEGIMESVDLAYGYVQGFNLLAFNDEKRQYYITNEHREMVEAIREKDIRHLLSSADFHLESCKLYCIKKYMENIKNGVSVF